MGALLHLLSRDAGSRRDLSVPAVVLLATGDDYLLELHRNDLEAEWRGEHPDGEVLAFETVPAMARLECELYVPSLFAPARLLVVRDAKELFEKDGKSDAQQLAEALARGRLVDVCLILAAELKSPPAGPVAEIVRRLGEVRFLPLPEPPKPWEQPGLTPPQRTVLRDLLRRTLPALRLPPETVDALCEAYGFKPRALVQAAERLALGGDLTPEAVRAQAGAGECSPREIEDLLIARDGEGLAGLLARLSSGAALVDWQGKALDPGETGAFLGRMLGRLLRQTLAVRCAGEESGLAAALDPKRCAENRWYVKTFKPSILPRLQPAIASDEYSPVATASPWQLHRLFRLAAPYTSRELLGALAGLGAAGVERERRPAWRLAALGSVLLTLTGPPRASRKAAAG